MPEIDKAAFIEAWPKCFIIFMGIIEVLAALVLFATELGNVAANFWTTNVFAGGWGGLIVLISAIALFVTTCCAPGPPAAFRAVVVAVIGIIACATMVAFNAVFIAQPTTCLLTSSCTTNAASNSTFSYYFQQAFYTTFHSLGPFTTYSQNQAKFLFQSIQIGVGGLCLILCVIYLVIYYVTRSKASQTVRTIRPAGNQFQGQSYSPAPYAAPQQPSAPRPVYRPPPPRAPQAPPGELPWNGRSGY